LRVGHHEGLLLGRLRPHSEAVLACLKNVIYALAYLVPMSVTKVKRFMKLPSGHFTRMENCEIKLEKNTKLNFLS